MRLVLFSLAFAGLVAAQSGTSSAMPGMMMPKCAAGDAVVMVDAKHKMYRMMTSADKKMMMHTGMTPMCKSKAAKMGAMMKGSPAMGGGATSMGGSSMGGSSMGGSSMGGSSTGSGSMKTTSPAPGTGQSPSSMMNGSSPGAVSPAPVPNTTRSPGSN